MTSLPDRGRLAVLPLPSLLLLLHGERFSGTVRLVCDPVTRTLELRDGKPVRVGAAGAGAGLCDWLLKSGRLSEQDAARVTAEKPRHGNSEERALLALRLLGPRDLCLGLRAYEGELLLDCFAWSDGFFELVPGPGPPEDTALFAHDPIALVHIGVSRHWSSERILAALGSAAQRFAAPGAGFAEAAESLEGLPGFEALRGRLDGRRSLGEAAREADCNGALAAAFALETLGVLEHSDTPRELTLEQGTAAGPERDTGPEIEIIVAGRDSPGEDAEAAASKEAAATRQRSEAASAVQDALLEKHARLKDLDYYALLEVERGANLADIRRAYMAAAKRFHPDAVARLGLDELREVANEVFARISKAHTALADPKRRAEYDENLAEGGLEDAQRLASAETFFRKGDALLRMGNFEQALSFLAPAVELCDDEPDYLVALGWALFKKPASDPEAARGHLERATALAPQHAMAHQRLGTVLRAMRQETEARKHLAKAQQLDPEAPKRR